MSSATGMLEKMTIVAFSDAELQTETESFVVMFNPTTFSVNHSNSYDQFAKPVKGVADQKQLKRNPRTLSLELFFDGTGVTDFSGTGRTGASQVSVSSTAPANSRVVEESLVDANVNTFLKVTYDIDSTEHRTPFLVFVWGSFLFAGVLESANVTYSLFDSNGRSLRAKVSLSVKEHITDKKLTKVLKLESPDLTQSRVVIAGDTLPNLAKKLYGDERLYVELAKANKLRNYRKLVPGQKLIFPPIEKIAKKA